MEHRTFSRPGGNVTLRTVFEGKRVLIEVEDECGGLSPARRRSRSSSRRRCNVRSLMHSSRATWSRRGSPSGKRRMIIVSGFNVYPNEVEAVAAACPGVAECACVGKLDEKTGEAVRLFVVRSPGAALTEADVMAHCGRALAAYKVPKQAQFLEGLPKSAVGKILRKDLRALS